MPKKLNKFLSLYYKRAEKKQILDENILGCVMCNGLNEPNKTQAAPGFGNLMSNIMFVGQSLCKPGMDTQIPFTRGSGDLLDQALFELGRMKQDFFTTNVIHCHPPNNRASKREEKSNCRSFLEREIELVKPRIIITLGMDARSQLEKMGATFPSSINVLNTSKYRGKHSIFKRKNMHFAFVYHPAYFMHQPNDGAQANWVTFIKDTIEFSDKKYGRFQFQGKVK